jgi:hypothetical protein
MITFTPKTSQFDHQKKLLEDTWDRPGYAVFWEQGTGKSKAFIDNGAVLYLEKAIGGSLLVAPNNLHRNFISREVPKHLPDEIAENARTLYWHNQKSKTKAWQNEAREFLKFDGYKILGMSYDGLITDLGKALTKEYLTSTKCLYGCDESNRIANLTAWRTKVVLASAPYAPFRRVLNGTPVTQAPWDVYPQIKFCDANFWKPHGLDSVEAMKATFGLWDKAVKRVPVGVAISRGKSLNYYYEKNDIPECLRTTFKQEGGVGLQYIPTQQTDEEGVPMYKNLHQLRDILEPIRSRVLKKDVLDLPPKLYTRLDFDLTPAQRRTYQEILEFGHTVAGDRAVSTNMALTVLLRLQQVCCGYLVTDMEPGDEDPIIIPIDPNPRIDLLKDVVDGVEHQGIIWARFTPDIDSICKTLQAMGKSFVRYDGQVDDDQCAANEESFHRGDAQWFVSNQAKGGEGLTLNEAKTMIYFSNSFKLRDRLQSEDRPHRYGQDTSVNVIDFLARGTMEERLINRLIGKFEVASIVNGDELKQWLQPIGRLL